MSSYKTLSMLVLAGMISLTMAAVLPNNLEDLQELIPPISFGGRQAAPSTWSGLLSSVVNTWLVPLFSNFSTGLTNAISATFANRRLQLLDYDGVPNEFRANSL